jgi:CubicO group peptidase (beta-lactamase class C family)
MFSNKQMSREELISWTLENVPLARPPGTKFAYSNFGYCVLGRVIEKVTRQRYADFVRDSVLARCGIDRMRIAGNSLDERAEGEVVHYRGTSNPYALDVTRLDATGGWLASATDLVRFVTHVDGLSYTPNILQTSSIATMTTPSAVHPRYAYGWGVIGGDWWHDGGLPGTTSIIARTQSGFCWAALANSNRSGSNQALDKSVRTMIRSVRGWSA